MMDLPALPIEIIEQILQNLGVKDLRSVRLVCRRIHRKGFRQSGSELFKIMTTDFSRKSLKRLQEFSNQQDVTHFVQILRVKPADEISYFGRDFNWTRDITGCLLSSNEGLNIVKSIMRRLQNIRSIHLFPTHKEQHIYRENAITHSDCLFILFIILTQEQRQIASFHCPPTPEVLPIKRGPFSLHRVYLDIRRVPFFVYRKHEVKDFRMNIQSLALDIDGSGIGAKSFIREFLSSVISLQSLSLGARLDDDVLETLSVADRCRRLEHLCLQGASFRKSSFVGFLDECGDTLHSLTLFAVSLKGADTWLQLLTELPVILPSLDYLSITRLFDGDHHRNKWNIFPGLTGDSVPPGSEEMGFKLYKGRRGMIWGIMGVTYSGQEMRKALDFIVTAGAII